MPEGDTVFRTAARLRTALAGKTLVRSDFRVPKYATLDLSGQTVEEVGSYGKHLFVRTPTLSVHTHLKMEGEWRVFTPGQRWTKPAFTARLILATAEAEAVGFALGTVEVLRREQEHTVVNRLGPDLLGPRWDAAEAVRRLSAAPDRPIALALLDQRNLAGIGNIFRSEICFIERVDPRRPVGSVPDLPALVDRAQRVLHSAAHDPPWRPYVYRRHRMPCRRCGTTLTLTLIGEGPDSERGIYFCTGCQE